jgi:ABC-type methionine transport system permease subunit
MRAGWVGLREGDGGGGAGILGGRCGHYRNFERTVDNFFLVVVLLFALLFAWARRLQERYVM